MCNAAGNGIREFLLEHAELSPVSFHMPGHKGSDIYKQYGYEAFLKKIMDCDITEICGADNLFQAEGIIKNVALKYEKLYRVKKSYLLVNGTSGGIIATVLASVKQGGKLIMARNCHKAVFNAVRLGKMEPVYAYPSRLEDYDISGPIEAEEIKNLLEKNPDAQAVILPSPNYYGICSDIKAIADVTHRFGKILIVDQAHGAHLNFMKGVPKSAEESGADISINSTHKTLASFTQSAVLNLNSDKIKIEDLEDKLQMTESSSPSYILMASLDVNADILINHGSELFERWQKNLEYFYEHVREIKGVRIVNTGKFFDRTKINIDMSAWGIDGMELEKRLIKKRIFCELTTGNILMCMTGIGNTKEDMKILLNALEEIAKSCEEDKKNITCYDEKGKNQRQELKYKDIWNKKRRIYDFSGSKELLNIDLCEGRICASSVIPYPPGIPLICPGEIIERDDIEYVKNLRKTGQKVIGINDDDQISVVFG
ncbi:MAG: aminotransferase class I/II-fold pyridoxal phosphate-dependent enzyme [Anaerovoracaceae bacterium]